MSDPAQSDAAAEWNEVATADLPVDATVRVEIGGDRVTEVSAEQGENVRLLARKREQ